MSAEELVVRVTPFGLTVDSITCGSVRPVIKVKQLEVDESNAVFVAVEQIKKELTPTAVGGVQVMFLYHVELVN